MGGAEGLEPNKQRKYNLYTVCTLRWEGPKVPSSRNKRDIIYKLSVLSQMGGAEGPGAQQIKEI